MAAERRAPHNAQMLQRWVGEHARGNDLVIMRLQRWISYMVMAAALDRVRNERDEPLFIAKGGVAMELRLQLRARATQDFDATFRASLESMIE